jgi:hypothetical protein
MFTPEILTVPVFSVLDGGAVLWPTIGAVLAWMLIAAFVGSALGLLREAVGAPLRKRVENKRVAELHVAPPASARECGAAA